MALCKKKIPHGEVGCVTPRTSLDSSIDIPSRLCLFIQGCAVCQALCWVLKANGEHS